MRSVYSFGAGKAVFGFQSVKVNPLLGGSIMGGQIPGASGVGTPFRDPNDRALSYPPSKIPGNKIASSSFLYLLGLGEALLAL